MKTTTYFLIALLPFLFNSCASEKTEFELSPANPSVKGGMKDYIEVEPGTYKFVKKNDYHYSISVKLKSKATTGKKFTEVYNLTMNPISIQLLEKGGNPPSFGGSFSFNGGSADIEKLLEQGESGFFTFSYQARIENFSDLQLESFYINTNATEYVAEENTTSSITSNASKLTGNENWDKIIADYEKFTDNYLRLAKKANSGDVSALSEYTAAMEEAQRLSEQLESAGDILTPPQLSKFMEVQTKFAKGAMELAQ